MIYTSFINHDINACDPFVLICFVIEGCVFDPHQEQTFVCLTYVLLNNKQNKEYVLLYK